MTLRLQKIVQAIPTVTTLCDVGCDHGYIGMGAWQQGKAQKVIFMDISAPSLAKAQNNCTNAQMPNCQFICQDGIKDVLCDCAVIAGMGGLETISILQNTKQLPQFLVLQPMRNQVDVRKYLLEHNYYITLDTKFCDVKYYDLIVAKRSSKPMQLTHLQLQFGVTNLASPSQDFVQYLLTEKQKYTQILTQCRDEVVEDKLSNINLALEHIGGTQ
ncbi:MAG: SAM-dependent methyltransferase [Clostridia bacterium]|nr:SAM-dependent methyltransferase [Clostridia bacterium]